MYSCSTESLAEVLMDLLNPSGERTHDGGAPFFALQVLAAPSRAAQVKR